MPRWPVKGIDKKSLSKRILSIIEVPISEEMSHDLYEIARSMAIPIKSVLLAAHASVLCLLTNQEEILSGLVSNGRPEESDSNEY